jgi:hypothetical protein
MNKTVRRITNSEEQDAETYRYWQSRPVGERLVAVCELSQAAYSFAADFRGVPGDDGQRPERPSQRVQRKRG